MELKNVCSLVFTVEPESLVKFVLGGDAVVVAEVVDELASAECIYKVKWNAARQLLPLEVIQLVK